MKTKRIIALIIISLGLLSAGFAVDTKPADPKGKLQGYALDTCIVTENDLDSMGGAVTKVHEKQEVKFCCRACIKKFEKDPKKYIARMEQAVADEAKAGSKAGTKKP